jgi:hypothetical protein
VSKQRTDFLWWSLVRKKLNQIERKEQYHFEIAKGFAALENLDNELDIGKLSEGKYTF